MLLKRKATVKHATRRNDTEEAQFVWATTRASEARNREHFASIIVTKVDIPWYEVSGHKNVRDV